MCIHVLILRRTSLQPATVMSDGLEDWELFLKVDASKRASLLSQIVRGPTDWTPDPILLESVRRQAAALVMASGTEE